MPSTRSGSSASAGAEEEEDTGRLLEDAAAELSSEIAARKAAEERVAALQAQLADQSADAFRTPGPAADLDEEGEEEEVGAARGIGQEQKRSWWSRFEWSTGFEFLTVSSMPPAPFRCQLNRQRQSRQREGPDRALVCIQRAPSARAMPPP